MQTQNCEIQMDRLERIEGEIDMLRDTTNKQSENILGITIGFERINNTIRNVIDMQEEHAKRIKEIKEEHAKKFSDIEPLSIVGRNWKFLGFLFLTIVIISLFIHTTLKEVIGWIT